jgi:menaquinone-dependent protoporphyrinogen IX oxidase
MRLIARHHHGPTDVTQDDVLTDWAAADSFARRCAALAAGAPPVQFPEVPS